MTDNYYFAGDDDDRDLNDSNFKMKQIHKRTLETRIQQFNRPRYQNLETKSKVLIELTRLHMDTAIDQSKVIDGLTKNLKDTNVRQKDTYKELEKYKVETKVNNSKLYWYAFTLFCLLLVMILLNWVMST